MDRPFKVIGRLSSVEQIAFGRQIRELRRLRRAYGGRNWRKLKAVARVRLPNGTIVKAELHCYEAHGLGRKEMKIKRFLVGR